MTLSSSFNIKELGSSIKIEVFAGISTFLALSYIFVVNPAILADAGINKSAAFLATMVGSARLRFIMTLIWSMLVPPVVKKQMVMELRPS
jgi:AGZA family xanthine/uracil permease-like MFS transporter